jgi:hypothetical protein
MVSLVKIISTEIDSLKGRIIKILKLGKSDVHTCLESMPFGIDANPLKGMSAIYAVTGSNGKKVIIGYLNRNQLAGVGELRLYSTDEGGKSKTYLWLKNDGVIEIGGNSDFMVRYSKLETAFNELQNKFNAFAESYIPGGPSTQGLPAKLQSSQADITKCKIETVKTL